VPALVEYLGCPFPEEAFIRMFDDDHRLVSGHDPAFSVIIHHIIIIIFIIFFFFFFFFFSTPLRG
jgi:hypothetical protein